MISTTRVATSVAAIALACIGSLTACGDAQDRQAADPPAALEPEEFDPNSFAHSTQIDNAWMPLEPGTRFVYEGTTVEDDGTEVPHQIVVNVTDLTKEIGGIRALVTWDLDYSEGQLVEAELAFLAQDTLGTVWRMGEYPEEYEDGEFIEAKPWIHGFEDAKAGIMMMADPQLGTPSCQRTCVPLDCYEDVLVIVEVSASEPDAEQLKYFARGVGNVRVGWRGEGEPTKETLELVRIEQLDEAAMAEVRAGALELEQSGYQRSNVYAQTPPAEVGGP
jgi:hypothetical protein